MNRPDMFCVCPNLDHLRALGSDTWAHQHYSLGPRTSLLHALGEFMHTLTSSLQANYSTTYPTAGTLSEKH